MLIGFTEVIQAVGRSSIGSGVRVRTHAQIREAITVRIRRRKDQEGRSRKAFVVLALLATAAAAANKPVRNAAATGLQAAASYGAAGRQRLAEIRTARELQGLGIDPDTDTFLRDRRGGDGSGNRSASSLAGQA